MVNLDDQDLYTSLDKSSMRQQIAGLPAQCMQAWNSAANFNLPQDYSDVDKVIILGMGGSAIGGDLLKALTASLSRPAVYVHRDYGLPAFVDEKTLVIASSYSGNTEETLSGFTAALSTKCKKLVISTGGQLTLLARTKGVPVFVIEHVSPPRAALGYSLLPLMAIMQNLGFTGSKSEEVKGMVTSLADQCRNWQEDSPQKNNGAKQLAVILDGKVIVVYGAGILSDVARRWKTQINENAKAWAFFEVLPELNHNAVLGYRYPAWARDKMYVVFLRCPFINMRTQLRYKFTGELLSQSKIDYQVLDGEGAGELTQMMSLVLLGDWVSYYLAILNGIDPSPVPEIDLLKKRLAESQ